MRNDHRMTVNLTIAETLRTIMRESDMTLEEQYEMCETIGYCMKKAAVAGGFLNVGDLLRWLDEQKT
jgi:hypothetical protein